MHPLRLVALPLALLATCLIALVDRATGVELSISVFYLLPIALATWAAGPLPGLGFALLSTGLWYVVDQRTGSAGLGGYVGLWNALIRFALFAVVVTLLARLRTQHQLLRSLASRDALTGAASRRRFFELLEREAGRAARTGAPLTLAYLDLDDFKAVNDRYGHAAGDRLLALVAEAMASAVRAADVLGRLGGDEFVVLLPDTGEREAAALLARLREEVSVRSAAAGMPVTASVGAIDFSGEVVRSEEMVRRVDALMYRSKRAGKDRVVMGEATAEGGAAPDGRHQPRPDP